MIPPVYSLLHGSATVVATVADRIGEHGVIFAKETRPYITWQIISQGAEVQLDTGRACHDRAMVQIDCWHAKSAGVMDLAEAVRTAVEAESYFSGVIADERDPDTLLYRIGMQFDFIL